MIPVGMDLLTWEGRELIASRKQDYRQNEPMVNSAVKRAMASPKTTSNGLAQGFYLSEQYQAVEIETTDYRLHPILGGVSSTRWSAYDSFVAGNSKLADELSKRRRFRSAIQLTSNKQDPRSYSDPALAAFGIKRLQANSYRLAAAGALSGDARANTLHGSHQSDLLMGWGGNDVLAGGKGDDLLTGGKGADKFIFSRGDLGNRLERDQISDFNGEEGDRIVVRAPKGSVASGDFSGKKGEVTFATWMARLDVKPGEEIQPWMYSGTHLNVDWNGDKRPDLFVSLPGVSSFNKDWIIFQ